MLEFLASPSPGLYGFFLALPLAVAGAIILAIARACGPQAGRRAALGAGAWLAFTGALGASEVLDVWAPPPVLLLFGAMLIFLAWAARRPWTEQLGTLPLQILVGFQGFRLLVELGLHAAVNQGIANPTMTWTGTNFDILPGVSALLLIPWVHRLDPRVLQAWNLTMAGILVVTVVTAILAAPTPLRQIFGDPANVFIASFPFIWLPTVLVTSAWLGHIVLFRRLRREPV
ncbi:MAG: hypothetical protein P8Q97_01405 [Myxococcota bacterium]|nr:hypothetical protein [Myxococcota bacterium]